LLSEVSENLPTVDRTFATSPEHAQLRAARRGTGLAGLRVMLNRNAATTLVLWVAAAIAPAGCGVEESDPLIDGPEAVHQLGDDGDSGTCRPSFGTSYVLDLLEVLPAGQGSDMTGDGEPDNALSILGSFVNSGWAEAFHEGTAIFLLDFKGLDGAVDPAVAFFIAMDADLPPDPSNNLTGDGDFEVIPESLDVSCQPTGGFEQVELADGSVLAETSRWAFVDPWTGTIEFTDTHAIATFSDDGQEVDARVDAVWTLCGLAHSLVPGSTAGTVLDLMVKGFGMDPDIDRDGDGLERVVPTESGGIMCIDGDGTEITTPGCACDDRIADGYSVAFHAHGIPAHILGVYDHLGSP